MFLSGLVDYRKNLFKFISDMYYEKLNVKFLVKQPFPYFAIIERLHKIFYKSYSPCNPPDPNDLIIIYLVSQ